MVVLQAVRHGSAAARAPPARRARARWSCSTRSWSCSWSSPACCGPGRSPTPAATPRDVAAGRPSPRSPAGRRRPGSSDVSYRLFSARQDHPARAAGPVRRRDPRLPRREDRRRRTCSSGTPARRSCGPRSCPPAQAPLTGRARPLDSVGSTRATLNAAAKVACAGLLQVFLLARPGLAAAGAVGGAGGAAAVRRASCAVLTFGAMAALGLIVLVPNLSVDYGVLRAFQQTLLVVAPRDGGGAVDGAAPAAGRAAATLVGRRPGRAAARPRRRAARAARRPAGAARAGELRYLLRPLLRLRRRDARRSTGWPGPTRRRRSTAPRSSPTATSTSGCSPPPTTRAPIADRLYPTLLTKRRLRLRRRADPRPRASRRSSTPAT